MAPSRTYDLHEADLRRVIQDVTARLAAAGIPTPDVDARWLVDHVVEVAGSPTGCGATLLDALVSRRAAREPLQVVIGRTWFRTLELRCAAGVFVPRPETEVVAGLAIEAARAARVARAAATGADAAAAGTGEDRTTRVVDACTGTGAIALSIAVEVPGVEVVAGDLSDAAVALASENLGRVRDGSAGATLATGSTVTVVTSDLLDGVDPAWRGHLDVLVANPPYLPAADRGTWQPEVAAHDPDRALVGGPDGHEVVNALLALAADWLVPGGTVVVEIDERRGADALATATSVGLADACIERDLTGADRALVAHRATRSR